MIWSVTFHFWVFKETNRENTYILVESLWLLSWIPRLCLECKTSTDFRSSTSIQKFGGYRVESLKLKLIDIQNYPHPYQAGNFVLDTHIADHLISPLWAHVIGGFSSFQLFLRGIITMLDIEYRLRWSANKHKIEIKHWSRYPQYKSS